MKLIWLLCISYVACSVNLWPKPMNVKNVNERVIVDSYHFKFECNANCDNILTKAFVRYKDLIFYSGILTPTWSYPNVFSTVYVEALESPELSVNVDESYKLLVTEESAKLSAKTVWGALHGLETLSQLIEWNRTSNNYYIQTAEIQDTPQFKWRGLLLDTARHFFGINSIFRIIDAMSYNKMNVLHWHLTDSQTFTFQSEVFPKLSQSAWVSDAVYTISDIKNVVEYAYERGVRVVPEIDSPGHVDSWYKGHPELFPTCPWETKNILDVTNPKTIDFVSKLITEVASVFPDEYIHLGGDEVFMDCWTADPKIAQFINQNGLKDYRGLQNSYIQKLVTVAKSLGKKPIFWEDSFIRDADGDQVTIQSWKTKAEYLFPEALQKNYHILYSNPWYLDKQTPDGRKEYAFQDTWKAFYEADPFGGEKLTEEQLKLYMGGEACLWTETVDEQNLDSWVWPRACGAAERLWNNDLPMIKDATNRLNEHRCRMVRRGISAGPIIPGYCDLGDKISKTVVPVEVGYSFLNMILVSIVQFISFVSILLIWKGKCRRT